VAVLKWQLTFRGFAKWRKIEAESFDFAPRRARTNLYEVNLIQKRIIFVLAVIEIQTFNLVHRPRFW